jgi:hypothetical protein
VAIALTVLMGFAALAVDIGVLHSARASAQRAADAAALAGAFTFVVDSTSPQPGAAVTHAVSVATSNTIFGAPISAGDVSVTTNVGAQTVTVRVTHRQRTFFAGVLGMNSVTIGATATAEAACNATGSKCARPWFLPNTVASVDTPPCEACASGQTMIQNGMVTQFGRSQIGAQWELDAVSPKEELDSEEFYVAKSKKKKGHDKKASKCVNEAIFCQLYEEIEVKDLLETKKNVKVGVKDLLNKRGKADVYIAPGRYKRADGTISDTSRQLISVPIWDVCSAPGFCPDARYPKDREEISVQMIGSAILFIESVKNDKKNKRGEVVTVRLIGINSCTSCFGAGPSPPESGPLAVPVRLVRATQ